jgi:uncharacterized membrane-anchored protein YitT (DUF2179 family)
MTSLQQFRSQFHHKFHHARWRERILSEVSDWRNLLLLTISAVLYGCVFNLFFVPAKVIPGGLGSIALVLNHLFGLPNGILMTLLNIPLLILGFLYLGRMRFLLRTGYVIVVINIVIDATAPWLASGITDDLLLNSLYGGVMAGVSGGLLLRAKGSMGGTYISARVLQMKTGIPLSQIFLITDGILIIMLGAVFGWENALYAMLALFLFGLASDYVLEGPSVIRMVFIVTKYSDEVTSNLQKRMGIGVTHWQGKGMYSRTPQEVLFCTISRPDVETLKSLVYEIDPTSFVVIGQGHQARGGTFGSHSQRARKPAQPPAYLAANPPAMPEADMGVQNPFLANDSSRSDSSSPDAVQTWYATSPEGNTPDNIDPNNINPDNPDGNTPDGNSWV